jgi:hypothetical protein
MLRRPRHDRARHRVQKEPVLQGVESDIFVEHVWRIINTRVPTRA